MSFLTPVSFSMRRPSSLLPTVDESDAVYNPGDMVDAQEEVRMLHISGSHSM